MRLSVTDVNDNSPNITSYSGLSLIVSENNNVGQILGNVSVSDEDSGENGRISFRVDPPNTPVSINDNGEFVMIACVHVLYLCVYVCSSVYIWFVYMCVCQNMYTHTHTIYTQTGV